MTYQNRQSTGLASPVVSAGPSQMGDTDVELSWEEKEELLDRTLEEMECEE